ncbi:hypothetical protein TcBrA4_0051430 [Trypanosoma cruzi]|nr:hypothetical protein TcBrA4_0051430 [Trypanosoma cruzi]
MRKLLSRFPSLLQLLKPISSVSNCYQGDQVNIALGPAVTGEVWSCPTSGVKRVGGSNAAMTEAVTVYIVEQAGVAVEAIGDAGDLSYATVEATLWRGLIGAHLRRRCVDR